MTTLSLTTADPSKARTEVLVVGAYAGPNGPVVADSDSVPG